MPMSSYGPPNMPDSIEFQIPAGQAIKLMCYYDPQHTSVYRADATPDSPLTDNSVEYMKKPGILRQTSRGISKCQRFKSAT